MTFKSYKGTPAQTRTVSPPGLIAVFAGEDGLAQTDVAVAMARENARLGLSVLVIDCANNDAAAQFGVNAAITLNDVLNDRAPLRDAKYITATGDIAVCLGGNADLDALLGPVTALSLSYDCVIVITPPGCTPAHVQLASAADETIMMFHAAGDRFMRAYWMLDAIRASAPRCDPFMVGAGSKTDVFETYDLFAGTVRDFLGGPPPLGGAVDGEAKDFAAQLQSCARYISAAFAPRSQSALTA